MDEITKQIKEMENKKSRFSDFIDNLNNVKIDNIKEVVNEINDMIDERKKLSLNLVNAYEGLLSRINAIIGRIPQENLREEITLHDKAVKIEEAKIREHVDCWRDIALLKKEMREVLRELREQESMQNTYADLFDEASENK